MRIAQIFCPACGLFIENQRVPPVELRGYAIDIPETRLSQASSKPTPEIEVMMSIQLGGTPN
jgi:hypothetical protein